MDGKKSPCSTVSWNSGITDENEPGSDASVDKISEKVYPEHKIAAQLKKSLDLKKDSYKKEVPLTGEGDSNNSKGESSGTGAETSVTEVSAPVVSSGPATGKKA